LKLTSFGHDSFLFELRRRVISIKSLLAESQESFELTVLLQQPRLLLFQRVNVFGSLLEDGGLKKLTN
jgi:hypothetical protein